MGEEKFIVKHVDNLSGGCGKSPWDGSVNAELDRAHLLIEHMSHTIEDLLKRVAYLEKAESLQSEAHKDYIAHITDMGTKLNAVYVRVFPLHGNFIGEVDRVLSRRQPSKGEGGTD